MVTIEKILLTFDPEPKNLLPALKKISAGFGYISKNDAEKVADYFSIPMSRVYESASFYDEIRLKKQSHLVIQVCSSTNCVVGKSLEIVREIENYFKIVAGDENNVKVKLELISCLGRCGEGPIVVVNSKVYQQVSVSGMHRILEEWT